MIWLTILSVVPSVLVGIGAYVIWRGKICDPRRPVIEGLYRLQEREKRMDVASRSLLDEPYGDVPYISEGKSDA